MRLSTKSRVAVSAMMYLATHDKQGPCNASVICANQGISVSYLEQLFAHLRRQQLVIGVRGPGGGYRLSRPADEINIAEIIAAVDDGSSTDRAENVVNLYQGEHSRIQDMWRDLSNRLQEFLSGITLAECVARSENASGPDPAPTASKAVG